MKNQLLIGLIIALVVVGAGAFYGGLAYGKNRGGLNSFKSGQPRFQGQAGQGNQLNRGGRPGGNFIVGEIIAKDQTSVTVKNQDGGSKIIFLSGNTQISKFSAASVADLTVGQSVMANGAANADGSLTAQMIQLRPARTADAAAPGQGSPAPLPQ